MTKGTKRQEAQRKRHASSKEKKFQKIIKKMDKRDKDPTDNTSDRAILREAGYSDYTKVSEVVNAPSFLKVRTEYYRTHKDYKQMEKRLEAKARRNLETGLDSENPKEKLEYTKLQLRQEEVQANRVKLEMKDTNGNLLTLFGSKVDELNEAITPVSNIIDIPNEENDDECV